MYRKLNLLSPAATIGHSSLAPSSHVRWASHSAKQRAARLATLNGLPAPVWGARNKYKFKGGRGSDLSAGGVLLVDPATGRPVRGPSRYGYSPLGFPRPAPPLQTTFGHNDQMPLRAVEAKEKKSPWESERVRTKGKANHKKEAERRNMNAMFDRDWQQKQYDERLLQELYHARQVTYEKGADLALDPRSAVYRMPNKPAKKPKKPQPSQPSQQQQQQQLQQQQGLSSADSSPAGPRFVATSEASSAASSEALEYERRAAFRKLSPEEKAAERKKRAAMRLEAAALAEMESKTQEELALLAKARAAGQELSDADEFAESSEAAAESDEDPQAAFIEEQLLKMDQRLAMASPKLGHLGFEGLNLAIQSHRIDPTEDDQNNELNASPSRHAVRHVRVGQAVKEVIGRVLWSRAIQKAEMAARKGVSKFVDIRKAGFLIRHIEMSKDLRFAKVKWHLKSDLRIAQAAAAGVIPDEFDSRVFPPAPSVYEHEIEKLARAELAAEIERSNKAKKQAEDKKRAKTLKIELTPLQKTVQTFLNACVGPIRYELGKDVNLKYVPDIRFDYDHQISREMEQGEIVSAILKKYGKVGEPIRPSLDAPAAEVSESYAERAARFKKEQQHMEQSLGHMLGAGAGVASASRFVADEDREALEEADERDEEANDYSDYDEYSDHDAHSEAEESDSSSGGQRFQK